MNRGKKNVTLKVQKKINKEVHSAQKEYSIKPEEQMSDGLTIKEMLKKFPKKQSARFEALLKTTQKKFALKNKKSPTKKVSKRTGPKEFVDPVPSVALNKEGKRWIKTLRKQTLAKETVQRHHDLKQKNSRKKIK